MKDINELVKFGSFALVKGKYDAIVEKIEEVQENIKKYDALLNEMNSVDKKMILKKI